MDKQLEKTAFSGDVIVGRNAVREALKRTPAPFKVYLQRGERRGSALPIVEEARTLKIPVEEVPKEKLDRLAAGVNHQGIAALASPVALVELEDILHAAEEKGEPPFLVIADRIADPHNFGALLRSCEGAGVHGVIFPKHDACPLTQTVMKSSAGAANHIPLCRVTNLVNTAKLLKEKGIWLCAVEAGGEAYDTFDYNTPLALVLGSEEAGIARLLLENCDFRISLPMKGKVNSLNVSCAAAAVLYTAVACRRR